MHRSNESRMTDVSTGRRLADDLLDIGAVTFSPAAPFTWSSGLLSPIYCDNRMTMGYPDVRKRIRDAFIERLRGADLHPDIVAGTATAGIPHAAWLADALDLPMVYVRSKPKKHGKASRIEGAIDSGRRVVVIEDLVSTGGSSIGVVETIRSAGAHVLGVLAIFSYELQQAEDAFSAVDVPLYTLTNLEHLLESARSNEELDDHDIASIAAWRMDPWRWTEDRIAEADR